jgi:Spy/CpxP family protein refolding chaperone
MDKIYKILTVIVLFFMTGITTNFYAQQGFGRDQIRQGERDREILEIPGLTGEQKEQIKNLHTDYLRDIQPFKNELNINRANLDALVTEDNPDMNEIKNLIYENGKLMTELRKKQVAHKLEIRDLLTEEQKVFFDNRTLRNDIRPYRYNFRSYRDDNRPYRYFNRPYRDGRTARRNHPYRHLW